MKKIQADLARLTIQAVCDTANTKNLAGGDAWEMTNQEKVHQIMLTGTFGDCFYASSTELVKEANECIQLMAQQDPRGLAREIVEGRTQGYIRSAPILGLAALSLYSPTEFRRVFSDVVRTGNDMEDFMGFIRALGRGFGSALKKAMNAWLAEKVEGKTFYALKYTKQVANAVRISRPKSTDPIYDYVIEKTRGEANDFGRALSTYPALQAMEDATKLIKDGLWKPAIDLIKRHNLDPASLLGLGNPPKDAWVAIADNMGVMMYLKYLSKIIREGAFNMDTMRQKLTVQNLQAAYVFPFRLYVAYQNIDQVNTDGQKVRDHLDSVLNAYSQEFNWNKWANKSIVIAPDVSGSMTHRLNNVSPATIAGMFSGFMYKGIPNSMVIPWAESAEEYKHPRSDSVVSHINRIEKANGGGTFMESPVRYMNENFVRADVFILITDSEEWGHGWLSQWIRYRSVNKTAKAVLIRIDSHNTRPFPEEKAAQYGIYQIFGWNDNVIKWIECKVL